METLEKQNKQPQVRVDESELEELGFTHAAKAVKEKRELARKMRIAFEHFRVVTIQHIQKFNAELAERTTQKNRSGGYTYQKLVFIPVAEYGEVPPAGALEALRAAKKLDCFDSFEVAKIESQTVVPDPILFGVIKGSLNKYFITQWDDDVKIEDILRPDEG